MAKRRRRKSSPKTKTIVRYRTKSPRRRVRRRNPTSRRVTSAASRVRSTVAGMNIRSALRGLPPTMVGMFAAKWAAKRFGSEASETDPESWTWASYLKGAAGAFVAGFLAQNLRAGWGQKVLEGGMSLMAYKLIENELIPKSEWAQAQFGEDETYFPEEYVQTDDQGTPYLLGQNGQWMPVDERHRLPEYGVMGDELQPVGRLGDELQPVGRLGDAWQSAYFGQERDPYAKGFFG